VASKIKESFMEDVEFALSEYIANAQFRDMSSYAVNVAKMSKKQIIRLYAFEEGEPGLHSDSEK
jgi:hypothetical protein